MSRVGFDGRDTVDEVNGIVKMRRLGVIWSSN